MLIGALFLFSSALLQQKPALVFASVYIGDHGPYRFLVDTGSQTSLIDPKLAAELRLRPEFRVEIVTQNSRRPMPGLKVRDLRIGGHVVPETELVFDDPNAARQLDSSVRGLLGVSALNGIDFALTPSTGRLELYANRPAGEAVPFYRVEGRIALKTRMGAETLLLTLDSGSTNVVLFHTPGAMAKTRSVPTAFATLEGARSVVPTTWTAEMTFADTLRVGVLPAAIVERRGAEIDGLLPASIFKTIYIDQAHGEAVLVRDSRSPRETK